MAKAMLTHLRRSGSYTTCGKQILYPEYLTEVKEEVTCGSCVRDPEARRLAQTAKRGQPGYADAQFPGLGILSCYACGRPIRDHPGWPCPFRPMGAVSVDR